MTCATSASANAAVRRHDRGGAHAPGRRRENRVERSEPRAARVQPQSLVQVVLADDHSGASRSRSSQGQTRRLLAVTTSCADVGELLQHLDGRGSRTASRLRSRRSGRGTGRAADDPRRRRRPARCCRARSCAPGAQTLQHGRGAPSGSGTGIGSAARSQPAGPGAACSGTGSPRSIASRTTVATSTPRASATATSRAWRLVVEQDLQTAIQRHVHTLACVCTCHDANGRPEAPVRWWLLSPSSCRTSWGRSRRARSAASGRTPRRPRRSPARALGGSRG